MIFTEAPCHATEPVRAKEAIFAQPHVRFKQADSYRLCQVLIVVASIVVAFVNELVAASGG